MTENVFIRATSTENIAYKKQQSTEKPLPKIISKYEKSVKIL